LLLHEYDFEIIHRAGLKHTNADVLSRFPIQKSDDSSGARFDGEVVEKVGTVSHKKPPLPRPLIDLFAPRFGDVFHQGLLHVDKHMYMDGVMRDATPDELDPDAAAAKKRFSEHAKEVVGMFSHIKHNIRSRADIAIQTSKMLDPQWNPGPDEKSGFRENLVDTSIVGPCFFPKVQEEHLVLFELCGGIAT